MQSLHPNSINSYPTLDVTLCLFHTQSYTIHQHLFNPWDFARKCIAQWPKVTFDDTYIISPSQRERRRKKKSNSRIGKRQFLRRGCSRSYILYSCICCAGALFSFHTARDATTRCNTAAACAHPRVVDPLRRNALWFWFVSYKAVFHFLFCRVDNY